MKQKPTHKILGVALAAALAVLAGGSRAATFAQSGTPAPAQSAALSTAPSLNSAAPATAGDEEVVRVDSRLSRVIVSVEQPGPFVWEVADNGRAQKDILVDGPDRPLQLVVLVDLAPGREKKSERIHYENLRRALDLLALHVRLKVRPVVFVSSSQAERLPYDFDWPASWETVYAGGLQGALDQSIARLDSGPGTVRRALLFLTNRADDLPPDTFRQLDVRLSRSASLVYLMSVKPPKVGGGRKKTIVRTNINGGDTTIFLEDNPNYVSTLFNIFVNSVNSMYVVSYHLPAEELVGAGDQPATRYVRATARSTATGQVLAWNERRYVPESTGAVAAVPAGDVTMRFAVMAASDCCQERRDCTPKELLARQLKARPASAVAEADKPRYRQELRDKPELRGQKLYGPETEESKRVREVIRPVLKAHDLDRVVEVWVLDQDAPFMGLYREFILIVSTGELSLLSKPQLRGAAAHEFSHLFFVDELREADASGDVLAHHLVEYKCDIFAALTSEIVGDGAESVIEAVALVEGWYSKAGRNDYEKSLHPTALQRQMCLRLFLSRGPKAVSEPRPDIGK
jgi:hypothetical protein